MQPSIRTFDLTVEMAARTADAIEHGLEFGHIVEDDNKTMMIGRLFALEMLCQDLGLTGAECVFDVAGEYFKADMFTDAIEELRTLLPEEIKVGA